MNYNIYPDDDVYDLSEEYFNKKGNNYDDDDEIEVYFPLEISKPPHY